MKPTSLLDKLYARSRKEGDCLIWTGPPRRDGYGQIRVGNKIMAVHRAAWIARHGPIPPETPYVLHECDVRLCWKDEHLRLGTQAENLADMTARGRRHSGDHWAEKRTLQGNPACN